jgi:FkbM family methyltransferase
VIEKILNKFLKFFSLKLIKIVDQFNNTYRLTLAFKEKNINYIIDVGANEGQFGKELRYYGYKDGILSFEPQRLANQKLKNFTSKDKNWTVFEPIALGDKNRDTQINISKNSVSSSILNIKDEHIKNAPDSKIIDTQIVQEKKLDDLFEDLKILDKNIFLKIDTQGYEYQVLKGSEKVLDQIEGILVELSLIELYKEQKNWLEIYNLVCKNNFELWSIDRGFTNKKNGRTLQIDMCFFRKN